MDQKIRQSKSIIIHPDVAFDQFLFQKIRQMDQRQKIRKYIINFRYIKLTTIGLTMIAIIILTTTFFLNQNLVIKPVASDNVLLAKLVYNEVVIEHEHMPLVEVDTVTSGFSQNFTYSELQIIESHYFKSILGFSLDPYFSVNTKDTEIEVMVVMLELKGKGNHVNDLWYTQEMIILKYRDDIVGFLSGEMGLVGGTPYPPKEGIFRFQSFNFLTKDQVVKYYEKGDFIYNFDVDLSDVDDIKVAARIDIARTDVPTKHYQGVVRSLSYTTLSSDVTISLINQVIVEKVYIEVIIVDLDLEEHIIYVTSEFMPSIESVHLLDPSQIYDDEGKNIEMSALSEGGRLIVYYYQRYQSYVPVNIYVDDIIYKSNQ